jgi:hypothetical protein
MCTSRFIPALFLLAVLRAIGQNPAEEKATLEKIRAEHLRYAAGAIPAYFSAGFETRALKYQKTIIACQRWYDQQVGKHVDLSLAVLDRKDWQTVSQPNDPYPMPYSKSLGGPVVVLPARFEDFPNSADFTDDVELLVENISYHEMGHIYADAIDIKSDDVLLQEMYANLFMVSFVRAQRPDMLSFLQGPPAKLSSQRYTSLEDLQYIYGDVGMTNYGWFQFQLYRMCDLLLQNKPLPKLLAELRTAFRDPTPRPFSQVATQLETIRHGIGAEMGALWNPTSIPSAQAKPCSQIASSGKESDLVVLNSSSKPIKVTLGTDAPVNVASNSWYTFSGHSGDLLRIDSGLCFVFGDQPSIAHMPAK